MSQSKGVRTREKKAAEIRPAMQTKERVRAIILREPLQKRKGRLVKIAENEDAIAWGRRAFQKMQRDAEFRPLFLRLSKLKIEALIAIPESIMEAQSEIFPIASEKPK